MKIEKKNEKAGCVVPFSRVVKRDGWIFVSGTTAITGLPGPIFERKPPLEFDIQARLTIENIKSSLNDSDCEIGDIVKINTILTDRKYYEYFNKIRGEYFFGNNMPVSTTWISDLFHPDLLIEIDVIARKI